MSSKTGRFIDDIDEWAEEVARMIIEAGGYVPSDVPLLARPGSTYEEGDKLD